MICNSNVSSNENTKCLIEYKTKKNKELAALIIECAKYSLLINAMNSQTQNIYYIYFEEYDKELLSIIIEHCITEKIDLKYKIIDNNINNKKYLELQFSYTKNIAKEKIKAYISSYLYMD
jgi:bifunctional DNase/RNase